MSAQAVSTGWMESRIHALDDLLRRHDYRGWDPFDVTNSPLLSWVPTDRQAPQLILSKLGARVLSDRGRRLLRVPEIEDPKIYACAYFGYRFGRVADGDARAAAMIQRLVDLADHGPEGAHWGYNYTWGTRTSGINPRRAPTLVPGAFSIFALLHDALASGGGRRDLIAAACAYYAARHRCGAKGRPFLGYFANISTNTHNANLLGCAALSLAGRALHRADWLEVSAVAAATTVSEVRDDGYLPYSDHRSGQWTDCFHHLYAIACILVVSDLNPSVDEERFKASAERMVGYLHREFLRTDGLINYFPGRLHPIDPHNYAVAAMVAVLLGRRVGLEPEAGARLLRRLDILMWDTAQRRYHYRRHARRLDRRLFMRWTQAWMFAALSTVAAGEDAVSSLRAMAPSLMR